MPGSETVSPCQELPCANYLLGLQDQIQQTFLLLSGLMPRIDAMTGQVTEARAEVKTVYRLLYMGNGQPSLKAQVEQHEKELVELRGQQQEQTRARLSLRHALWITLISVAASGLLTAVLAWVK